MSCIHSRFPRRRDLKRPAFWQAGAVEVVKDTVSAAYKDVGSEPNELLTERLPLRPASTSRGSGVMAELLGQHTDGAACLILLLRLFHRGS